MPVGEGVAGAGKGGGGGRRSRREKGRDGRPRRREREERWPMAAVLACGEARPATTHAAVFWEPSDVSLSVGCGAEFLPACGCDSVPTGSPASSFPSPTGTAGCRGFLLLHGNSGGLLHRGNRRLRKEARREEKEMKERKKEKE
ncbi:Os05g0444875 [Oryza sativa Japonica Group]|uniref:Os05g0444875 protein n=1 Tax=Oryza sativa subsp. japonica TaxID=39947 RepID=A0A0P0WN47_ORYSJ|nr:Os05g0444875 [Oryza sativa Japonica Group]